MALECIVPDLLWHATQPLRFGPLQISTRMTVVRLSDGCLWVHSPITPTPELVDALNRLGSVRYVVAPNKSHHLFFLPFLGAMPSAQGFITAGLAAKRPDLGRFAHIPLDAPWRSDLQAYRIDGLPILDETVWFHPQTGTLILTDLLFCFSPAHRGLNGLVTRILGVRGVLAMSRTMKMAVRDKQALAASVAPLRALPVQRVILAHDQIIEQQARTQLVQAFAWLQ